MLLIVANILSALLGTLGYFEFNLRSVAAPAEMSELVIFYLFTGNYYS